MYDCNQCLNQFLDENDFENHECIWFCELCCCTFKTKQMYTKHMQSKKHIQNKTIIQCENCEKVFASLQSKRNHFKTCQKYSIQKYVYDDKCIVCKQSVKGYSKYETICHIKKHKGVDDDNLRLLMDGLKDKVNHVTYNNFNINITNNNNIVIFGNEDFSYINKHDIQEALKTKNALPRLCRLMRRNPHHPENRNIKVTDFARGKTQVFTENGWEPAQPIDTFNNLIMEASDILDNKSQENKLNPIELAKVDTITDNVHELDMAVDRGSDTQWGKESRREIMMEFV